MTNYLGRRPIRSTNAITVSFETMCRLLTLPLWVCGLIDEKQFQDALKTLPDRAYHDHPRYIFNHWSYWLVSQGLPGLSTVERYQQSTQSVPEDTIIPLKLLGVELSGLQDMFRKVAERSPYEHPFELFWEHWWLASDIQYTVKPTRCTIHFDLSVGKRIVSAMERIQLPI